MPRTTASKISQARVQPKRIPNINSSRAFGPKSPIVDKDIQSFLAFCMTSWDSYTDEERQEIIQSLPPSRRPQDATFQDNSSKYPPNSLRAIHGDSRSVEMEGNIQASNRPPVPADVMASDTYIKRATARFKRDIADGYYEKSWQDKAKRAHQERRQGKFDDYLDQCVAEMFTSTAEESEDLDHDKDDSDEDFVMGRKECHKKPKTSNNGQVEAKPFAMRRKRSS